MNTNWIQWLQQVQQGQMSIEDAAVHLEHLTAPHRSGIESLGYAQLDIYREQRTGFPEVIFGEGKSAEQIIAIIDRLSRHADRVLTTRVSPDKAALILEHHPDCVYHEAARCLVWLSAPILPHAHGYVAVVTAGTTDVPVAEEAAITAECMGSQVKRIYDVGVAGIHRLFRQMPEIAGASAIVVAAGMEGALASVVAGLVDKPLIAVPTSSGYGANLGGMSALLTMINSCAPGISVVNIDNGFGAGYNAGLIHKHLQQTDDSSQHNAKGENL